MSFTISEDNQNKSVSGLSTKTLVTEMIDEIKDLPKINITVLENSKVGYPNQVPMFYMDKEIIFNDYNSEKWLIKTTSSVRVDRVMGNEWFAQNIFLLDKSIDRIYLTVPDSIDEKELKHARNYSNRTQDPTITSFLTDVVTVYELKWLIIERALQKESVHVRSNILGALAEHDTVEALNNTKNWLLWNDYTVNKALNKTQSFRRFRKIMEKIGLNMGADRIEKVEAIKYDVLLKNRGKPKTDVIFSMRTFDKIKTHKISIKNTNRKEVTIHEGKMIDIIDALQIDKELSEALLTFESVGSIKKLKEVDENSLNIIEALLPAYNKQLVKLFFFGDGSLQVNNSDQIADMVLYNQKFEVKLADEFVEYYISNFSNRGQLNTPFKWTYPSGSRGKKIQIKGFTNN